MRGAHFTYLVESECLETRINKFEVRLRQMREKREIEYEIRIFLIDGKE